MANAKDAGTQCNTALEQGRVASDLDGDHDQASKNFSRATTGHQDQDPNDVPR